MKVKMLMLSKGVLQEDIARALGKSQPTVSAKLNGKTGTTLAEARIIADVLGVSLDELADALGHPHYEPEDEDECSPILQMCM